MPDLVIVQPYVPQYRVPFFNMLNEWLGERGLTMSIAAPAARGAQALRADAVDVPLAVAPPRKHRQLVTPFASFQDYGTTRLIGHASAVIVPASATVLDTYWALFGPNRRRRAVGLWGHIDGFVKKPNPIDTIIERALLRRADHVFAYTERGGRVALKAGVAPSAVSVVNNTIDTLALEQACADVTTEDVDNFKRVRGITSPTVFGYMGGLDESKEIPFFAQVLEVLHSERADIQFIVGGRGAHEHLLDEAVSRGQVVRLGYVGTTEKALMSAASTALVNPGRIGLVAVDAMACGIPLLTSPHALHAPEYEYLQEGVSVCTGPADAYNYAHWLLSTAFSRYEATPPTLSSMVQRFGEGVVQMINSRNGDESCAAY